MKKIKNFINTYNFAFTLISIGIFLGCLCILSWSLVVNFLNFCDRRPESMGVVITFVISCIAGLFTLHEYLYLKKKGKLKIHHLCDSIKNCFDVNIDDIKERNDGSAENTQSFQCMDLEHRKIFANNKKMAISKIAEEIEELESLIYENGATGDTDYFHKILKIVTIMRDTLVSINSVYDLLCTDSPDIADMKAAIKMVVDNYNNNNKRTLKTYNDEIKKYFRLSYTFFEEK